MWSIEQEQNESKTQEELPISIKPIVKAKFKLFKPGMEQSQSQQSEIDLDMYLSTQRTSQKETRKRVKTQEEIDQQKQFKQGYGMGFKLLQNMGFKNVLKGLGKDEQGRTNIVEAQFKTELSARDEEYEEEQEQKRRERQQSEDREREERQKEQELIKFNQLQFEELLGYTSKIPRVNSLLIAIKNKYESLQSKLSLSQKETDSFERDMEMGESMRLQKSNQLSQVETELEQLNGLQSDSFSNALKYPHLGLKYNCDLLLVKEVMALMDQQRIEQEGALERVKNLIKGVKEKLFSFYLAKEKQAIRAYNDTSIVILQHSRERSRLETSEQITTISLADENKIKNYCSEIISLTILPKMRGYFTRMKDIRMCKEHIIDLMEFSFKNCQQSKELKDKLIIPMINRYLIKYEGGPLPHLVVFPWLIVLTMEEIDLQGFINRIISCKWKLQENHLLELITPWLKYMPIKVRKYFLSFYLAPWILHALQGFKIEEGNISLLKGAKKYMQFLPMKLRAKILEETLVLCLFQMYKSQQGSEEDVRKWLERWVRQVDRMVDQKGWMSEIIKQNYGIEI